MFLDVVQQAVHTGSVLAVLADQLVHRFIQAASNLTTGQDQSDSEKMVRMSSSASTLTFSLLMTSNNATNS